MHQVFLDQLPSRDRPKLVHWCSTRIFIMLPRFETGESGVFKLGV